MEGLGSVFQMDNLPPNLSIYPSIWTSKWTSSRLSNTADFCGFRKANGQVQPGTLF